jgi:hypothetical protein
LRGWEKEKTPDDEFLFLKTEFLRQRNRFVTEIKKLLREMDLIISIPEDA